MVVWSARATSWANLRDGLYLSASRKTIVSRRTPAKKANSSCVKPNFNLFALILFLIPLGPNAQNVKDDGVSQQLGADKEGQDVADLREHRIDIAINH